MINIIKKLEEIIKCVGINYLKFNKKFMNYG